MALSHLMCFSKNCLIFVKNMRSKNKSENGPNLDPFWSPNGSPKSTSWAPKSVLGGGRFRTPILVRKLDPLDPILAPILDLILLTFASSRGLASSKCDFQKTVENDVPTSCRRPHLFWVPFDVPTFWFERSTSPHFLTSPHFRVGRSGCNHRFHRKRHGPPKATWP